MTETAVGREPVQIVELVQPFCGHEWSKGRCRAGSGTISDAFNINWSDEDISDWVALNCTLTAMGGDGMRMVSTSTNPSFYLPAGTDSFSGDDWRYVILRGKIVTKVTPQFLCHYASAAGSFGVTRRMFATNYATLNPLADGTDFIAVFDAADSTNYATDWQGEDVTGLLFEIDEGNAAEYEFYSIEIANQNPLEQTATACFNTRATCQDADNFDRSELSLFFAKGSVAESGVSGAPYIIPSLVSVSTSPTKINLSAANPDASGLGNRAVCNITFRDHPHSDRVVDPYLSDRAYDPMQRGSFWSKWMKRNKYRYNMTIRVYDGYAGQALSAMTKRSYILTAASGPDEKGAVKIQGKDILAKLEERKAQIPEASPGLLFADIDASQTEFKVQAATVSDYAVSGTLRINDELMTYSAVALVGAELQFTISERGSDGTTAAEHSQEDQVQDCIRYTDEPVQDIVEDLLARADIDASYIDSTSFDDESADFLTAYTLSTVLSEPIAITTLISELQVQCSFMIWWDERTAKIKMKAVRGITETPDLLTDDANILAGSFSVSDLPKSRVSQLWFYFARRDVVGGLDAPNFAQVYVQADLASESEDQFGEPSIRKVFSRWVDSSGQALSTSSKLISRYRDVPRQCKLRLDAKDRTYWVGDTVRISHFLDVDEFGERTIANWTIVSAEEVTPGEVVEYVAEDTTLYGQVSRIQADGASDYSTGDSLFLGWIGDASGLLSDGEKSSRTA